MFHVFLISLFIHFNIYLFILKAKGLISFRFFLFMLLNFILQMITTLFNFYEANTTHVYLYPMKLLPNLGTWKSTKTEIPGNGASDRDQKKIVEHVKQGGRDDPVERRPGPGSAEHWKESSGAERLSTILEYTPGFVSQVFRIRIGQSDLVAEEERKDPVGKRRSVPVEGTIVRYKTRRPLTCKGWEGGRPASGFLLQLVQGT